MNLPPKRIILLDYLRILACLGVFSCHLWSGLLNYLANYWNELGQINLAMPECLGIHGDSLYKCGVQTFFLLPNDRFTHLVFNISNIFLGLGYQGVHLFFFLSGFGLSFSALVSIQQKGEKSIKWLNFLKKRLLRLYPPYWIILTFYMLLNYSLYGSFLGWMKSYIKGGIFLDVIPATWFIPIVIQLYLIFPILFYFLRKATIKDFLIRAFLVKIVTSSIIIIGSIFIFGKLIGFGNGALAPGGIALTRLFEFALGMTLAKVFVDNHYSFNIFEKFKKWDILIVGFSSQLLGLFLSSKYASFYIASHSVPIGLIFSDVFLGVGVVCLAINFVLMLYPFISFINSNLINLISNGTYQAFLLHGVLLGYFINVFSLPILALSQPITKIENLLYLLFAFTFILIIFSFINLFLGSYLEKFVKLKI